MASLRFTITASGLACLAAAACGGDSVTPLEDGDAPDRPPVVDSVWLEPPLHRAIGVLGAQETLAGAVASLAGEALGIAPQEPGSQPSRRSEGPAAGAAMEILEEAEARLRDGDFAGFGEALERLRRALQAMDSTTTSGG